MSNIMKTFKTIEVINIVSYLNNTMKEDQVKELPTKVRWNLKKNIDKLIPVAKSFEEFRDNMIKELQSEYFNDEKSYEYAEVKKDSDGNPILRDDGTEETEQMRKVKDEYLDEYSEAVKDLNDKLQEILVEENDIEIATINMDAFVDSLPDDTTIDFDCLNIMCFMDETTNVKEAK